MFSEKNTSLCDFTQQNYKTGEKYKRDQKMIILNCSPPTILAEIRTTLPLLGLSSKFTLQTQSTINLEPLMNVAKSPHLHA